MIKNGRVYSICAVVLGVIGYAARSFVLKNGFEAETGLAIRGYLWTNILIAVGVIAVLLSAAAAVISRAKCKPNEEYKLSEKHSTYFLGILGAALLLVGGILYYVECAASGIGNNFLYVLFTVLSVTGGICLGIVSFKRVRGAKLNGMGTSLSILSVFFCFWLVMVYRENSTDPVLLTYCFTALALAFATLAFYYTVGWFIGRKNMGMFIVTHFSAIVFAIIAMADFGFSGEFWILLGITLTVFANLFTFEKTEIEESEE